MKTNQTILASCYAINPYEGSQDEMGWNFVCQIARFRKVIAVTRENNRTSIEKYIAEHPDSIYRNISFLYFDLPHWMRFWKKGRRGALLYYYLWQKGIVSFIKKQKLEFDITHNVNFHDDRTPSFLWKFHKPMVWGPVEPHSLIPEQYLNMYSKTYFLQDRFMWMMKNLFRKFSCSLKKTVKHSENTWYLNTVVPEKLEFTEDLYPSANAEDFKQHLEVNPKSGFTAISVGRFVPLKAFDLTIRSFIGFINYLPEKDKAQCRLILVGTVKQKALYENLIRQNGMNDFIEIIDWIERKELIKLYESASVFLFPSHEGAGMVVPEALSFGLPVISLQNDGSGKFINNSCGVLVPQQNYKKTIEELSLTLVRLFLDQPLRKKLSLGARKQYVEKFSLNKK
ncbi:glycosyltransferase [Chryseobacterium cheonjiense]|uniref:Glycosyltransferase n=1 Tax=Chryseobacterium cheonjiense TaxID=2728845 RepID=A0A7Y0A559_9FLAO|nr:glycosyltransferase [Chryseobacterium cheonjiense]NML56879.1 glycosyltransferase [Chryseobacterium cheonjiense]